MTNFLLIHGAGHGAWVWDEVGALLEDSLRRGTGLYHSVYSPGAVLAPDLPGHGSRFCRDDPTRLSFEGAVDSLLAHMDESGVKRPVVAVHDLSGLIALEVVRRMKEPPADSSNSSKEPLWRPIRAASTSPRTNTRSSPIWPRGCR